MKIKPTDPCYPTGTSIYLDNTVAGRYTANFSQLKLPVLQTFNQGERISIDVQKDDLQTLLQNILTDLGAAEGGVRIYFGNLCTNGDAECDDIASGYEDLLTLIFVPAKKNNNIYTDIPGNHYTIDGNGNLKILTNTDTKDTWTEDYTKNRGKWSKLSSTAQQNVETKCIVYEKYKIQELLKTVKCLNNNGILISAKIEFGAYLKDQPLKDYINEHGARATTIIGNQLMIFFSLYDSTDRIEFENLAITSYDTGLPCPPDTYCLQ